MDNTLLHDTILRTCAINRENPLQIYYYGRLITIGQFLRATGLNVPKLTETEAEQLSIHHKYTKDTIFNAFTY